MAHLLPISFDPRHLAWRVKHLGAQGTGLNRLSQAYLSKFRLFNAAIDPKIKIDLLLAHLKIVLIAFF